MTRNEDSKEETVVNFSFKTLSHIATVGRWRPATKAEQSNPVEAVAQPALNDNILADFAADCPSNRGTK